MMVAVFAAMFLTLGFGWLQRRALALLSLLVCLVLYVWLFLFEIYDQQYGFRMPWIQVELGSHRGGAA
ncbi:hypothetical protein BH10PSE9_BH10PSE9_23690 [soil metagenome]